MKMQRIAGALSRVAIWNVNPLSVQFCGIGSSLIFFGRRRRTYQIESMTFLGSTRKIMSRLGPFWKDHLFRTFEENIIFPCIFLRKINFHFPSGGNIIFSGKRNIIFPNNTRKIKLHRDFFGKTIFSGRLEKENMVFRAVLHRICFSLKIASSIFNL